MYISVMVYLATFICAKKHQIISFDIYYIREIFKDLIWPCLIEEVYSIDFYCPDFRCG